MRNRAGFFFACLTGLLCLAWSGGAARALPIPSQPSAEERDLAALLQETVLSAEISQEEVVRFCENRVPAVPRVSGPGEWEKHAAAWRRDVLDKVVFRGEAAAWRREKTRAEWLESIPGGKEYRIRKLRFEVLPGLWIPALLYEPLNLTGRVPVGLAVNGHDPAGKSVEYKQIRCINQVKRGMIVLNVEWFGMGQLRQDGFTHYKANELDLCGTSAVSPFYLSLQRSLDILLQHPHADRRRVAVSGLSGGGWQTIFLSALDPRVTLSNPVAGYSSFATRARFPSDLGDTEQTPCDLGTVVDYAHLTAMRAPRPTLLTFNARDNCCFRADHALQPLLDAAAPVFSLFGKAGFLTSHVNFDPGTHNYEKENREQFYKVLGTYFWPGAPYDWHEIPCQEEIRTAEQLQVALPEKNLHFHSLALALGASLPRGNQPPGEPAQKAAWRQGRRALLRETVRFRPYSVQAEKAGERKAGNIAVTFWRLKMGRDWTVPAVEFCPLDWERTALLIADQGRKGTSPRVSGLLGQKYRVMVLDPFYLGESAIAQRAALYAILMAGLGERALGVQAGQIAAAAEWLQKTGSGREVEVWSIGPRTSLMGLAAAALQPEAISRVKSQDPLSSLKQILERGPGIEQAPEQYCFALLERFDIPDLQDLAANR